MGRHTSNKQVVMALQGALEAFLADHRKNAENDPKWINDTKNATPAELENEPGCGCDDCITAGLLLGRIY